LLAAGVLSAFLGLLQLAQGPHSPLRFFAVTNTTEAVGFFANRNHFAALIYCVLLFAFAWTAEAVSRFQTAPRGNKSAQLSTLVVASFIVLVVLIAAQVMARSRAGLIISMAAIGAGLLLSLPFRSKRASQLSAARIIGAAAAVALIFLMQFGLFRLFQRFEADPLADARIFFARNTLEAANAFLPFGSGLGSFVRVYGLHEKPHDAMANTYANHAHNDILELFLETGWVGPIVAAIAGFWLSVRIVKTWAWSTSGTALIDTTLARASGFLIIFLILHSWVDYPLRTAAMMAVFAFACGLLVEPFASARESQGAALTDGSENGPSPIGGYDQLSPESVSLSVPAPKWSPEETGAGASAQSHIEIPTDSVPKAQRWGQDIKWPEAWQSKSRSPSKPN
ncbi:MAG: O-antigen ligase family protein, partial [Hyphomicrobium sp.]